MARLDQVQHYFEPLEKQLGFAAIVQAGKTLYLSGLIAVNEKMELVAPGDMAGQLAAIYDHMEKVLAMCNATLAHVVNETLFATDLEALARHSGVRVARYARCAPPAATGVQVAGLFLPGALVEIQATAVLD